MMHEEFLWVTYKENNNKMKSRGFNIMITILFLLSKLDLINKSKLISNSIRHEKKQMIYEQSSPKVSNSQNVQKK